MTRNASDWEIEPEFSLAPPAPAPEIVDEPIGGLAPMGLEQVLPEFPLLTLLRFLPDVALKQRLDERAAEARGLQVLGAEGLKRADDLLTGLRSGVGGVELLFDGTAADPGPTALAHQLHKRLTGLRGDFCKQANAAIEDLNRRIVAETRRLKAIEEEAARKAQALADEEIRRNAARAVETAKARGEPAAVVETLKGMAETATAPPVARSWSTGRAMAASAVVEKWKTRFAGTPEDAQNPQPGVKDMSKAQLVLFREICRKVANEDLPAAVLAGIDWAYLDARAKKEKRTLEIPGIEAYDEGSVRGKRRG